MPAPLDKEAVKTDMIKAFQRCAEKKPLPQVSLRDLAKELGVSHGSILYYFKNKDELLIECSRWAGRQFCDMIRTWFSEHKLSDYSSEREFFDAFLAFSLTDESTEAMPRGVVMMCVMGDYSEKLKADIQAEGRLIRQTLKISVEKSTARTLSDEETQAMFMLLLGAYFCSFIGAMGSYGASVYSCMKSLM